jgi:hypothetical protein
LGYFPLALGGRTKFGIFIFLHLLGTNSLHLLSTRMIKLNGLWFLDAGQLAKILWFLFRIGYFGFGGNFIFLFLGFGKNKVLGNLVFLWLWVTGFWIWFLFILYMSGRYNTM